MTELFVCVGLLWFLFKEFAWLCEKVSTFNKWKRNLLEKKSDPNPVVVILVVNGCCHRPSDQ